ncbi:MAG: hypothetical protein KDA66_07280, partial [Planctomycetaceae bacterium]|nr:hypothetical protein [Planctomycetaceae bacterium]
LRGDFDLNLPLANTSKEFRLYNLVVQHAREQRDQLVANAEPGSRLEYDKAYDYVFRSIIIATRVTFGQRIDDEEVSRLLQEVEDFSQGNPSVLPPETTASNEELVKQTLLGVAGQMLRCLTPTALISSKSRMEIRRFIVSHAPVESTQIQEILETFESQQTPHALHLAAIRIESIVALLPEIEDSKVVELAWDSVSESIDHLPNPNQYDSLSDDGVRWNGNLRASLRGWLKFDLANGDRAGYLARFAKLSTLAKQYESLVDDKDDDFSSLQALTPGNKAFDLMEGVEIAGESDATWATILDEPSIFVFTFCSCNHEVQTLRKALSLEARIGSKIVFAASQESAIERAQKEFGGGFPILKVDEIPKWLETAPAVILVGESGRIAAATFGVPSDKLIDDWAERFGPAKE